MADGGAGAADAWIVHVVVGLIEMLEGRTSTGQVLSLDLLAISARFCCVLAHVWCIWDREAQRGRFVRRLLDLAIMGSAIVVNAGGFVRCTAGICWVL